jgi:hypothetical protein
MIDYLANTSKKYRRALSGEDFAMFSLIGTEDWEDYASLSFTAMQTEAIVDLEARLEQLVEVVERMDQKLGLISEALTSTATADHDGALPTRD